MDVYLIVIPNKTAGEQAIENEGGGDMANESHIAPRVLYESSGGPGYINMCVRVWWCAHRHCSGDLLTHLLRHRVRGPSRIEPHRNGD